MDMETIFRRKISLYYLFFNGWKITSILLNKKFYVRAERVSYFAQGEVMEELEMETRESIIVQSAVNLHYISKNSLAP